MIDSQMLRNAIYSAEKNIRVHADEVNNLNVFPVPDGDTGTNLALTLSGCVKALKNYPDTGAGKLADFIAGELLRCARGNSGVIFSLIFKGFAESIEGLESIDAVSLAKGLEAGCDEAYAAIDKPTEGTMLTVIRIAASKALSYAKRDKTAEETFEAAIAGAKASLKTTPNLLPILKKHGVVDAGGQGLVYIMEGMMNTESNTSNAPSDSVISKTLLNEAENIEFTYCTEFLINVTEDMDLTEFRKFLGSIGDCPVATFHSGTVKVHVHTNSPDKAISAALEHGELSSIKIDNMRLQAKEKISDECHMISLCSGNGIKELFEANSGVYALECSGTMNASAGDILEAVNSCPADNIFISPNNKNTVLAAKRAAVMSPKRVWVTNAKTLPEGIAAATAFNPEYTPEKNVAEMENSVSNVLSGAVTYAARDGSFNEKNFSQGQIIGLEGENIVCAGEDIDGTAVRIILRLLDKSENKKVTLIYGKDTLGYNAEKVVNTVLARYGDIEIEQFYGGQPLYYYIISVE